MKSHDVVLGAVCAALLGLASAPASAQAPGSAPVRSSAGAASFNVPQGFNIVLVVGDTAPARDGGAADTLPAAAQRALNDMRDFLPYRSYRLLDTAWILGSATSGGISSRLRGPDNVDYEVRLNASAVPQSAGGGSQRISVKFVLGPAGDEPAGGSARVLPISEAQARVTTLEAQLLQAEQRLNPQHPDMRAMRRALEEARARLEAARVHGVSSTSLIDTSFTMDIGETVVVGTSRLQGSAALIAVLTAVPKK